MIKRFFLIAFLLLFIGVSFCVYWLRMGYELVTLREGLYLFTSFFATIGSLFAFSRFGLKNARAISLLCLTAGMGYWFLGEVIFNYYQYFLNIDPFPSVADVFYIFGYLYIFIALLNEIIISRVNWRLINKTTLFLVSIVAILFAIIISYFGIYKAYDPSEVFLTNAIAIGYGVGDLFLILASMMLLILALEFRGGKLSRVWFILFLGFISTLVADILFAVYLEQYEMLEWFYKSLADSFWMVGYLLFAWALFEFGFSIQDIYKRIGQLKVNNNEGGLPLRSPDPKQG